jgi:hypothetical protein
VVNIIADNLPAAPDSLSQANRETIICKIAAFVGELSAAIRA